ncbi:MAG: glycine cleavage system aminomethyltransferase GcvT [Deltaproteobacteria bacterium]|nr:glycine cleavage system aminomethyltransferase GcvT [Deltaproteobacteria bacterium]
MASANDALTTPLVSVHKSLKAKMVPFGGWLMPVSYTSVLQEHKAVRETCGIFDVSHMGEVIVTGVRAGAFLQYLTINDISKLDDGSGQYSAMLHEHGGMIDDLIIYRLKSDKYLLCVNASNTAKDFAWIEKQAAKFGGVQVANESDQWSQLAVQGPNSAAAVEALIGAAELAQFRSLQYMDIMSIKLFGMVALVARTGYTGEHGYEIYLPNDLAEKTWTALMETQPRSGIQPIGLGARNTLRLEACYLLYGNDMNDDVSPLEAGIAWATRLTKGDFIGRSALVAQKEAGPKRSQFAFVMSDEGIPRSGMEIYRNDEKIGVVTSGSVLPTIGGAGGMALITRGKASLNDEVHVDIRGKRKLARFVQKPLYKAKVKG